MRTALGEDNGQAWHQHFLVSGRPDADRWTGPTTSLASYLEPAASDRLEAEDAAALRLLLADLRDQEVRLVGDSQTPAVHTSPVAQWYPVNEALTRPAVAEFIANRLLELPAEHWAIASTIRDKYTLNHLWPGLVKYLKKSTVRSLVKEIDDASELRNLVGAHYNPYAEALSWEEARTFGENVQALFAALYCEDCNGWLSESSQTDAVCECGQLTLLLKAADIPVPGVQAVINPPATVIP